MFTKIFLLIIIIGFSNTREHLGTRKSIIPRHESEKGVLFRVTKPTEGLYKRSQMGETFDSGVLHKLENFLLKSIDDLGLSSKKSDIEDQKEVETIAEDIEARPLTSGVSHGIKGSAKEEAKDTVLKAPRNGDKKKSVVSRKEEISGENTNTREEKNKVDEAETEKAKDKSTKKSEKEKEAKGEGNNDKRAKKDDVAGKDTLAKAQMLESLKKEKVTHDSATKRDQAVPDEDAEYGSSPSNPALSCTDLFTKFPNLPSGSYWVQSADRKEKMLLFCEKNVEYIKPKLDSGKEWKPSESGKASGSAQSPPLRLGAKRPPPVIHPVVGDHLKWEDDPDIDEGPEDPDQLKNGMWPFESVTKILPEEAVKNATDLKLPPPPGPQPFIPAKEPNQALQAPSTGTKDNSTSTDKAKNGTSDSKKITDVTSNATNDISTGKNTTSGNKNVESGANLNKTEPTKSESANATSNSTSENSSSAKPAIAKNNNESKAEENEKSNSTKTEDSSKQKQTESKTGNKEGKAEEINKADGAAEKVLGEGSLFGTGVGKLVDPAKPKNESVVTSGKTSTSLGPKASENHEENAAPSKAPQTTLAKMNENAPAQQPKTGSVSQESVSVKKPQQGFNEPIKTESSVAPEKPNQGSQPAQEKPIQNTKTAGMNSPMAQSTTAPNEQMAQTKPVSLNPSMNKALTNDQLAQNTPAKDNELVQSRPVPNQQKAQNSAGQGGTMAQNSPAANINVMQGKPASNEIVQSKPVEGAIMSQNKPAENVIAVQNKPEDSAGAQNKPAEGAVVAQNKPVENFIVAQNKPAENLIVAQNKPAENLIVAQNKPGDSARVAQNKPAESAIVAQNKPGEGGIVAQKKPAESAIVALSKPGESGVVAQNSPVENTILAHNKPAEGALMAQNKPAENAIVAQNKLAESPLMAQKKPAEGAIVAQNKPAENAIVAQNKLAEKYPSEGAIVAQNKPAESAIVTQNKLAPSNNMAKVNAGNGDDLSFDLFGDDAAPVDASPKIDQQANKQQEQAAIGNEIPANSLDFINPQVLNNEQTIPMIKEKATEAAGPAAVQKRPLTHEKMIELSSPPITNIGHTNFATEKNLYLPFKNAKTEGINRPGKVINQFIGNGAEHGTQEPAVKPKAPKQNAPAVSETEGLDSIFPTVVPTGASVVKLVTPLKPTVATKKSPETLEEFENERLVKQGSVPNMNVGLLESLPVVSNEGKSTVETRNGTTSWWADDYGLLGDAPWVRNKAPGVPKSDEKANNKKGDEAKKTEEKKKPEEGKKDEGRKDEGKKDEGKTDEGKKDDGKKDESKKDESKKDESKAETEKDKEKEVNSDKKETKKNEEKGRTEKAEGKIDNENSAKKNKTEDAKEEKTEKSSDTEKSKKEDSKGEASKDAKVKNTTKSEEDKGKDANKVKESSDNSKSMENSKNASATDNVLNSKASYQYIENRTTGLDNHEYHEALGKNNETDGNSQKANNSVTNQEQFQAQNLVPDHSSNKTHGISSMAKQNAWPTSNNPIGSGSPHMTSAGDVHQIPSNLPISSALPLAALPVSSPDHPQFYVSSPVSNQGTTTTTSLLPVDPSTGDHMLNTSLVLVARHGDVGTIPESSIIGSDQVDWMRKNVPSKDSLESAMKSFVSAKKIPENMEYSIDDIGKKKSALNPKSLVPSRETEKKKMKAKQVTDSKVIKQSIKRDTFNKIQKALEGTNLTIQNGVSSHMTFKSFVPRLSIDDIVDEEKRSLIPNSKKSKGKISAKRSWEKNLGKVIGALDGNNFSMQNEVASHITFKSSIEPVSLIRTKKLQKLLGDIGGTGSKEGASSKGGASQGDKGKHVSSVGDLMNSKGEKSKNKKLTKKKKEEKVPFKARKTIKDVKKKRKMLKKQQKAAEKRKPNLTSGVKGLKKFTGKQIRSISNKNEVKRSKTGKPHFNYKTETHKVPLKGANHSEAKIISTFSGTKNARESKSVTITNADRGSVSNVTNENGTLEVDAKAQDKRNGTEDGKKTPKGNAKGDKANKSGSVAELKNSNKTLEKDDNSVENGKNSTTQKPSERGVFEPDIGTMKKMPETTDIKHHIVGSSEKGNHTSIGNGTAETLLRGNLTEHKVIENNTLHAIYNVRRISEESNENGTNLLLKNIQEHHIDGNNTLSVVYNMKPRPGNGTNSTSKVLVRNLEEHHIDKDTVLHAKLNNQKAQKKGSIENSNGQVGGAKVHGRKNENSKWKNGNRRNKASETSGKSPTKAAGRGKGIGKDTKGRKVSSKTEKHQMVKSKSLKENGTKEKSENQLNNAKREEEKKKKKVNGVVESLKKNSKDVKSYGSGKKKSKPEGPVSVAIKGSAKKTKPKKLKRIGLVLPEKDRETSKTKAEKLRAAENKKTKAKNKGDAGGNAIGNYKEIKSTKGVHGKDKKNERNNGYTKQLQKGKEMENNTALKKIKDVKKGSGKASKLAMEKSTKQNMESRITQEKKERKKVGMQVSKIVEKIKKIANISRKNASEKQKGKMKSRKEKSKGKSKTVKGEEERLKKIQKQKKVRTIFFPQIFMKRTHIPKNHGHRAVKARQLIPTQVGNIEPSQGATQNPVPGQEQVSKNSDKPSPEKENGNVTQPGSALYENNKTMDGMKNKSDDSKGNQGSKNSADATADIDQVLNLTVGFLNKTFHDHFGKGSHEKDKVNGTDDKVSQNATNAWSNSKGTGTSNAENGTKNGTSNMVNNFESAQNETKNGNSTATNWHNLAGNVSSTQNHTETGNVTSGPLDSSKQNLTNQIGNSTAENQSKPSNISGAFRSERIPGISKAAAVSDMMSPIENYILNIINETGHEKFGNQSTADGKRASTKSNETSASGIDSLANLLSKSNGRLSLKSNEVNIKLAPKGNTKSTRTLTTATAGAGMMLNIASKRSKLSGLKTKVTQQNKSKGKRKDQAKSTKFIKATKNMSSKSAEDKPTIASLRPLGKHERPTAKTNQNAAATKSGIKFASTNKLQKVVTISKGPVTLGFTNKVVGATKPRMKDRKRELKKSVKIKDDVSKKNAKEATEKFDTSLKASKSQNKGDNEKKTDTKDRKKSKKVKRQTEKDKSNENKNGNSGSLPIKIDGQKIDWGPLSENWPNYGSG